MLAIQSHKSRFYCIRWISFSLTITCSLKVLHETFFEPFGNPPEEQGGELSRLEGELSTFYKCFPVYIISFVSQARETFHIVEEILKSNKSWWNKIWLVLFIYLSHLAFSWTALADRRDRVSLYRVSSQHSHSYISSIRSAQFFYSYALPQASYSLLCGIFLANFSVSMSERLAEKILDSIFISCCTGTCFLPHASPLLQCPC